MALLNCDGHLLATKALWVTLTALPMALGGCLAPSVGQPADPGKDVITVVRPVPVGFPLRGWELSVCLRGEAGEPLQAFEVLLARRRGDLLPITSAHDLQRLRPEICTTNEALAFVSLLTDPTLYHLFSPPVGITPTVADLTHTRYLAGLTRECAERLSLQPADVQEASPGAFRVTRCLLIPSPVYDGAQMGYPVLSVQEQVGRQGAYEVHGARLLGLARKDEVLGRLPTDWGWWEFGRGLADRLVAEPNGYHPRLLKE